MEDVVLPVDVEDAILENALPVIGIRTKKWERYHYEFENLPLVLHALHFVIHAKHDLTIFLIVVVLVDDIIGVVKI